MTEENNGLRQLLDTAQRVQQEMAQAQDRLGRLTVEGSAGGGMVLVTANGRQQITSIRIEAQMLDPADVEMLQDLVMAATNAALTKAATAAQEEMSKVTGGLNLQIPGLNL